MSQVMLNYYRAQTFVPPRQGLYLVWQGHIPRLAIWDGIKWIAAEDAGKVNPRRVNDITYWAKIPTVDRLQECDPTIQDRKHEIRPIEPPKLAAQEVEEHPEEGVD